MNQEIKDMKGPKKDTFSYTYSAVQQEEIQKIRRKYMPSEPKSVDKMEQLRRLDAGVMKKSSILALCVGGIGALIMGFGMSLIMTDLGEILSMDQSFIVGIVIGIIGMMGMIAAYPFYQYTAKKERNRIAPQVLQLIEELSEK